MEYTIKEISCTLDAFHIYDIFHEEKNSVFLDSGMDENNLGRYSFIGLNPFLTLKSDEEHCYINDELCHNSEVFNELNKIIKEYPIVNHTDIPFVCGGMGYFSYDLCREVEVLPRNSLEDVKIPLCYFNFYDNIIIYDNLFKKVYISALGILQNPEKSIMNIEDNIINASSNYKNCTVSIGDLSIKKEIFKSNFLKKDYLNSIEKVRNYIKEGHIYITNLTQRFTCNTNKDPFNVYTTLRTINPAPFAAYMNLDGFSVVSSSPERFLKINNSIVETRPIKGTRPRGKDRIEDIKNKEELLNSEKDKSELLMIVDLERNDLSKVCMENSIKVKELFKLETYSTVYHLVSSIEGKLNENVTSIDCIKACFPGGSITGAPKIRSMEIIDELEGLRRNIYTGSIGYLGFEGNIDLSIVIRTILMKDNKAYFGVGGGITWESNCEDEYYETIDKAKALMKALS